MIKGKRVCVTGGAGFLGSQLVDLLVEEGCEVFVLDNLARGDNINPQASLLPIDISLLESCKHAFKGGTAKHKVVDTHKVADIVFNLAATVAGVHYNQSNNVAMFNENVLLQTIPVAAAEAVGVPTFIQVSSACIYSPTHNHPCLEKNGHIGEPHPANGGYAWAKRVGEKVALLSKIPNVVVVRPSNVWGPRDYFDGKAHVIPNLIKKCLDDSETIEMSSPPTIQREFVFSRDMAAGMLAAAKYGCDRQAYNLGANGGKHCVTLETLLALVQKACGTNKPVNWANQTFDPGDPARWSDARKANEELEWQVTTSLEDGLRETVAWRLKQQN